MPGGRQGYGGRFLENSCFRHNAGGYRWTPWWTIKKGAEFNPTKDERNQKMKEHDHIPLRQAITAIARETDLKVLVCCEDMTQVALGREMLVDPLPEDVKKKVVWSSVGMRGNVKMGKGKARYGSVFARWERGSKNIR